MSKEMNTWVYDLETYPDIFTFVFRKVSKDSKKLTFEISIRKNELKELLIFLKQEKLVLIGYNNVNFDYPILHQILTKKNTTLKSLYEFVQAMINSDSSARIWESNVKIPQIDLFLIWHYNNMARSCSLKWLEFSTRWEKVQDLPFPPGFNVGLSNFDKLIEYNHNDVDFTYSFLFKSLKAISFRQGLSLKLNHNVMNYSDVKIGEYINQVTYSKLSGKNYNSFKNLRTKRGNIKLTDIIEESIQFKTPYLQDFLKNLKSKWFNEDGSGDKIDTYLKFANNSFKFAKGGLHTEDVPRIVNVKEGHILQEKDVASYYPASIVNSKLYPEHLGLEWYNGVTESFNRRTFEIKPKMKKLDKDSEEYKNLDVEQAGIKLALNGGSFGKLGSEFSWQYDPLQKYKITINCELKLLMLIESFDLINVEIHSANTDGVVIEYPESLKKQVDVIHSEWESKFNYILEDTNYSKLIFSSVNDYIAEIIDYKTKKVIKHKYKGDFEIDKDFHKNNSQRIVALAVKRYFIDGISINDTIKNHKDIFDFCIGRKGTKTSYYSLIKGNDTIDIKDKVFRYYISNSGYKLYKIYHQKGTHSSVNKGFKVSSFMEYYKSDNYDIDYDFYINECNKIINPIKIGTNRLNRPKSVQLDIFDLGA